MDELLTIYDQNFNITGTAERAVAHTIGMWHAVVHCWVISKRQDGIWIWFQKRAHTEKAFPDYYDTAVGGHISAGEKAIEAVLRETQEELGLYLQESDVNLLGITKEDEVFAESPLQDREFCYVFLYEDVNPPFAPGEEVDDMVRICLTDLSAKELHGAKTVPAVTMQGKKLVLRAEDFCIHPGEFAHFILPRLEELQ